ncbi:hypothetical protein SDC9_92167 [bioreactor metagenome]|uniref:TadE-like domain-containing protein n=1 Tax=bioreactor metagenome TaxID=1076179 RepID=A0A644ZWY4_9ZZZZ
MEILSKFKKSQKGQAMVEFALVLPVLLILILGSIDAGWLLYTKISATAAARETARAVSVLDATEFASAKAKGFVDEKKTPVPGTETFVILPPTYSEGAQLTVTVTTYVSPLVGFLPTSIIPDSVEIVSEVSMRLE